MEDEDKHRRWTAAFAGYGLFGVIAAFGYQPLLRYFPPHFHGLLFLFLGIAICALYEAWLSKSRIVMNIGYTIGTVMVVVTLLFSFYAIDRTGAASISNDRRCLIIEREMMRGEPRRGDLPDMFQAFGCRPQTDIMPRRPPPTPTPFPPYNVTPTQRPADCRLDILKTSMCKRACFGTGSVLAQAPT